MIELVISRIQIGIANSDCIPWCKAIWKQHAINDTNQTAAIRTVTLLDDLDLISGNDVLYGNDGNDVIHGQHGFDRLYGGNGDDELFGEEDSDYCYGEEGNDIILGDSGWIIRKKKTSTASLDTYDFYTDDTGYHIHKDVVLEEVVNFTRVIPLSTTQNSTSNDLARDILNSNYVILLGAYSFYLLTLI